MIKSKFTFSIFFLLLTIAILTQAGQSLASTHCKELNHVNCYSGFNEGNFCSKKDQTKTETRWYYDKGACRKFVYKGCNGNRNRFCTRDACERRCVGE